MYCTALIAGPGSSVGCASAWHADGRELDLRVRQHSFVEIDHGIISTVILSFDWDVKPQIKQTNKTDLLSQIYIFRFLIGF